MEHTEDLGNYKYGVFYYNKNDRRIIVPKRVKYLGWTLNFARPVSYFIMGVLIALIVVAWMVAPGK